VQSGNAATSGARMVPVGAVWEIDELEHAGGEHLVADFVAGFDDKQGHPDADEDLGVLGSFGLGANSTVVDFGAGTGQFALPAARRFATVVAVDVSPAMHAALQARARQQGLDNLHPVLAGFLSYEHAGPPADGAYTRHALHQLPDFWKAVALHRIAAIVRPGGVLRLRDLVYDFTPGEAGDVFARWLDGASTDSAHGYTREDYVEHIRTEHSTFRWLLEPMLDVAGFDIVDAEFPGPTYGAYTCVRR